MKILGLLLHAATAALLCLIALAAAAADYPAPKEGDWIARDFRFHTGDVMPELRLHYTTVGAPTGTARADPARHHRFRRQHAVAGVRRRTVRPRPAARREQVLHHPAGRHRHRQIVQTFRRPARQISAIQLRRHGRGTIPAGDRRPGCPPSAPRARQLDGRHAHLDLGRELSGLHGCAGADGVAAHRDVRPQLDDAAHADRRHPQRSGLEQRRLHHAAALAADRQRVLRHRHVTAAHWRYHKLAPTREQADKLLDERLAAPFKADANDFLYQWDASRDYNPAPGLERVQAALLAINSADDERNPPETRNPGARTQARSRTAACT